MKNIFNIIFVRDTHICPWWCCFTFDNPIRKLFQNPYKILSPYVKNGYTVIDIGPGMGYFTIPLCKLVGQEGRVIAVDIQEKMLRALKNRAIKAGVNQNLATHHSEPDEFGINDKADFILAFWMIHEVLDQIRFFKNVKKLMKSNSSLLISEPIFHVTKNRFEQTLEKAIKAGFKQKDRPRISLSRSVLLAIE